MTERQLTGRVVTLMEDRVLREYLDFLGAEGPGLMRGIVETYLKETPAIVEDLGEALSQGEYSGAASLAHKLKSSALSIGADSLAARCADLEVTCRNRLTPHPASYAAIVADFTAARGTLKTFLKDIG